MSVTLIGLVCLVLVVSASSSTTASEFASSAAYRGGFTKRRSGSRGNPTQWCIPYNTTAEFDGVWLGSVLGADFDGHVTGMMAYQGGGGTLMNFYGHWSTASGHSFEMWELWTPTKTIVAMRMPDLNDPSVAGVCVVTVAGASGDGSLCSNDDEVHMHYDSQQTSGTRSVELWVEEFPDGFDGSNMPNGSSLQISIERTGRKLPWGVDEALPIYHSLNSPDGTWTVDFAVINAQPTVDPKAFVLPPDCVVPVAMEANPEPLAAPRCPFARTLQMQP